MSLLSMLRHEGLGYGVSSPLCVRAALAVVVREFNEPPAMGALLLIVSFNPYRDQMI